ncbi:Rep family protein [Weissella cibaria]|uniref:Rep family protein n=1 Tax=Weissella cibaria TaxID=137591 RepID=UPI00106E2A9B|nr:Rep family protein [Weissella cibaria]
MADKLESRNHMLVQHIACLPFKIDDIPSIMERLNTKNYAYIIHDKDTRDGELVEPHIHLVMQFENARHVTAIAKELGVEPNYVEIWDKRINNAWSYLIHETADATKKKLYSPDDVTASFDYAAKISSIRSGVDKNALNEDLELLADGTISKSELRRKLGVIQYSKHRKLIDDVFQTFLEEKHSLWLESHDTDVPMKFIWLYGSAGSGKSLTADAMIEGLDSVKLGASNDYFQDYQGQSHIILNELRPNDISWADLLRLTDPWQLDKSAPRRYRNVPLNIDTLIITTPYNPYDFYNSTRVANRDVDAVDQLIRRIDKLGYFQKGQAPQFFNPNENDKPTTFPSDDLPF